MAGGLVGSAVGMRIGEDRGTCQGLEYSRISCLASATYFLGSSEKEEPPKKAAVGLLVLLASILKQSMLPIDAPTHTIVPALVKLDCSDILY